MNLQATLSRIDWHQLQINGTRFMGLLMLAAACTKTYLWVSLLGWTGLLLNVQFLLYVLFFALFCVWFAQHYPTPALLAAAGGVLAAVLM